MNSKLDSDDLGVAIVKGASNPEVRDLVTELSEIVLDSFLEEGVLKEIPVLKSIVACRKTWGAIHDQLFLRKVASFISACPRFTETEREQFGKEHLSDRRKAKKLGDAIVLILDKLDDFEKPEMLAKLFAGLMRRQISYDAFRRLATGIDIASVEDLKALGGKPIVPEFLAEAYPTGLVRCGFAHWVLRSNSLGSKLGQAAEISELGKLFMNCMIQE